MKQKLTILSLRTSGERREGEGEGEEVKVKRREGGRRDWREVFEDEGKVVEKILKGEEVKEKQRSAT